MLSASTASTFSPRFHALSCPGKFCSLCAPGIDALKSSVRYLLRIARVSRRRRESNPLDPLGITRCNPGHSSLYATGISLSLRLLGAPCRRGYAQSGFLGTIIPPSSAGRCPAPTGFFSSAPNPIPRLLAVSTQAMGVGPCASRRLPAQGITSTAGSSHAGLIPGQGMHALAWVKPQVVLGNPCSR